jgi:Fic family protein
MPFDRTIPHNDLPNLPPPQEVETRAVLKSLAPAARELAELKGLGALIPNQEILISTVPLLEARSSSEIENIVTTADELFRLASNATAAADPATKEALRYRAALLHGYESLRKRPLCTRTAVNLCSILRETETDVRKVPGTTISNAATGEVLYTPPEGEEIIRRKLSNWERFLHECTEIDPLVRMAAAHYQFEAIHPFTDGNGRTGRILNILFLIQEGLLDIPVLYLSQFIIRRKTDYYRLLRRVTENGEWEAWILFVLAAVEETSRWTARKIIAVKELLDHTCNYVRGSLPKIYSRELVEVAFVQPYCRIRNMVDAGVAKRQTASDYLKQLVSVGVLVEVRHGREKLFIHPKLLNLLTGDENDFPRYAIG